MDRAVFNFLNLEISSPWLDKTMILVSSEELWIGCILSALAIAIYQKNKFAMIGLLTSLLAVGISDATSSYMLKPFFDRIRPCKDLIPDIEVRVVSGCAGVWSMPSNHASNSAAGVMWLWLYGFKKWANILFIVVLLVGISRIYLGYHYPSDIIVGFLWGSIVALGMHFVAKKKFP